MCTTFNSLAACTTKAGMANLSKETVCKWCASNYRHLQLSSSSMITYRLRTFLHSVLIQARQRLLELLDLFLDSSNAIERSVQLLECLVNEWLLRIVHIIQLILN